MRNDNDTIPFPLPVTATRATLLTIMHSVMTLPQLVVRILGGVVPREEIRFARSSAVRGARTSSTDAWHAQDD